MRVPEEVVVYVTLGDRSAAGITDDKRLVIWQCTNSYNHVSAEIELDPHVVKYIQELVDVHAPKEENPL